ncbi:Oidioi.mRNA.OKI2018_I69.PAR.g12974.t1.cds [Oikopleura dioica]|uniref:Tubulin delta chain n=1 Tax=Oikopleura dioica TaxID=34765 RepID=A0ABN7S9G8_OIKDI|nr:Oidioi.mRNA.OKI2018_I69.PAR.g12974.t1.cds [Oikopleura dioica]
MPITVALGQCGNQISHCLTELMWDEGLRDGFFVEKQNGKVYARNVLIDMEPKVIESVMKKSEANAWNYSKTAAITARSGSGNNWAFGYSVLGERNQETIQRQIRKLAEDSDSINDGFLVMLAMAGGTGSGVGSRTVESIREEYGSKVPIVAHAVWPYSTGEVVVQNYNTLLTLNSLNNSTDGIIFHQNSSITDIIQSRFDLKNVAYSDINNYVAKELASILLPIKDSDGALHKMPIYQIAVDLCPSPNFKCLTPRSLPQLHNPKRAFLTYSNDLLLKYMHQLCLTGNFNENSGNMNMKSVTNRSIAMNAYIRGKNEGCEKIESCLNDDKIFSDKIAPTDRFNSYLAKKPFLKHETFLSTLSADQTLIEPLETVLSQSWDMFNHRAFLHRYEAYSIDSEHFVNSFAHLEQMQHSLKSL